MPGARKAIPTVRIASVHDDVRLTERTALLTVTGPTPGEAGKIEIALEAAVKLLHALQQSIPAMIDLREKAGLAVPDLAVSVSTIDGFEVSLSEDLESAKLSLRTADRIETQVSLSMVDLRSIHTTITDVLARADSARRRRNLN